MNPINSILIPFLISFSIFACSESNTKNSNKTYDAMKIKANHKSHIVSLKPTIDYSSIFLTIERGAFHYDKFILKDTIITYYPSSKNLSKEYDRYNKISEQKISQKTRDEFIKKIIENGFFELKDSYESNTKCTSSLLVTFEFNNQSKKIFSEDFKRKCPKLLQFIEREIVRLHNRNLIRVFLPG